MNGTSDLDRLLARKHELDRRTAESAKLAARLDELRAWQSERLDHTYAELRREPRYVRALEFFLGDLYGPGDSTRRDDELKRAMRPLKRALPTRLLEVLCRAMELQVLTLELDQEMAAALRPGLITAPTYAAAYRAVGRSADRRRQIELILQIGADLAGLVRQKWIGIALRAAHVPARAAGFGVLQSFLERGFQAFQQISDSRELLAAIRTRETQLLEALLKGDDAEISNITQRTAANARA